MAFPERVETERLVLRRPVARDRGAWAAVWADPRVSADLRPGQPADANHASTRFDHHLRHWREHGFGLWLVEVEGQVAGWAGPARPDFAPEVAGAVEVGWTLRSPYWGRGLATEAARAAVATSFAELEGDELISLIHPATRRSIAVAERLGMRHDRDVRPGELGSELRVYVLPCPR